MLRSQSTFSCTVTSGRPGEFWVLLVRLPFWAHQTARLRQGVTQRAICGGPTAFSILTASVATFPGSSSQKAHWGTGMASHQQLGCLRAGKVNPDGNEGSYLPEWAHCLLHDGRLHSRKCQVFVVPVRRCAPTYRTGGAAAVGCESGGVKLLKPRCANSIL
jgi:hypothetical protein